MTDPEDTPADVVDYLHRPVGERLADAWPPDHGDEPEVREELHRRGVHLDPHDHFDIETTED